MQPFMTDQHPSDLSFKKPRSALRPIAMAILLLAAMTAALPPVAGYIVFSALRRDFQGRLQGRYEPVFFKTAFRIKDVRWALPGKVRVESGSAFVGYQLFSILDGNGLRVQVKAEKIPVEVTSAVFGKNFKKITLEYVTADIKLQDGDLREIYHLEVVSPELNLKIGQ